MPLERRSAPACWTTNRLRTLTQHVGPVFLARLVASSRCSGCFLVSNRTLWIWLNNSLHARFNTYTARGPFNGAVEAYLRQGLRGDMDRAAIWLRVHFYFFLRSNIIFPSCRIPWHVQNSMDRRTGDTPSSSAVLQSCHSDKGIATETRSAVLCGDYDEHVVPRQCDRRDTYREETVEQGYTTDGKRRTPPFSSSKSQVKETPAG